ncbi:ABC transporter ATP-binding protein [Nocardioides litoris]|uniref:ABC transporter ATP-binding protein n=1 Tax=Nocardioides litoris TaxID=1926648 RepID=UPI001FE8FFEA|nr:ABC transporter ATP-binding protein [Nocardioides litoris]
MSLLRLLRRHLAPHRRLVALVVALELASVVALLVLPLLNARIIDEGIVPGDLGRVGSAGAVMLAVSLAQAVVAAGSSYAGAAVAAAFGRDVRRGLFSHVGGLSSREVHGFGVPSLVTRCTNDVQQVQLFVLLTLTMVLTAPLLLVGGVVMAVRVDVGLSWVLLAAAPVLALVVTALVAWMVPSSRRLQELLDRTNEVLRDQLVGLRVVRAFAREQRESERFAGVNDELTRVSRRMGRMTAALTPVVVVTTSLAVAGVLWFGGHRVDDGQLAIGSLAAYLTYVVQVLAATAVLALVVVMLPRAMVCADRVTAVLEARSSTAGPRPGGPRSLVPRAVRGALRVEGVGVRRPGADEPLLHGVDLDVRPGEVVAVVGSTGSGKTLLLSLLARLLDPTVGRVLLDGHDVRDLDRGVLAGAVGLVPQASYLFGGTVRSNLCLGRPDASDDELWRALEVAQAAGFVAGLDDGLDAVVHPGGTNLSGGQRQRLCVARALVPRPRVYLLDDVFSALDAATGARLRRALRERTADAAVLLVAQRVDEAREADRVVVLDQGRVVGLGHHDDLLLTCPTYAEIAASQQLAGVTA